MQVKSGKELGQLIRQQRKDAGLTLSAAANLCNVGYVFLSELENGKPSVQLDKVLQVLACLGIDLFAAPRGNHYDNRSWGGVEAPALGSRQDIVAAPSAVARVVRGFGKTSLVDETQVGPDVAAAVVRHQMAGSGKGSGRQGIVKNRDVTATVVPSTPYRRGGETSGFGNIPDRVVKVSRQSMSALLDLPDSEIRTSAREEGVAIRYAEKVQRDDPHGDPTPGSGKD